MNVVNVIEDYVFVDLTEEDGVQDGVVMDFDIDDIDFGFDVIADVDVDILDVDVDVDVDIPDVDVDVDVDVEYGFEQAFADALYESILKGEYCLKPVRGEDGRMRYTLKMLK